MLGVGEQFPEYKTQACFGNSKDDLKEISNDFHKDKWAVYIFYPKDFTFV